MPPAAAGQPYVRCGTVGPDNHWLVTLSPDGRYLAALTSTGTVRLLSTSDWTEVADFASPVGVVDALAFSPDGEMLATWSGELGLVALWGVSDGCLLRTFVVPPHATSYAQGALAFSPDSQTLAVGPTLVVTLDAPARLWIPPVNPKLPINLESETRALTFAASGTRLMTYSLDPAGNAGWISQLVLRDPANLSSVTFGIGDLWLDVDGATLSGDGRWIAVVTSSSSSEPPVGLSLIDTAAGIRVAGDPASAPTLLGFGPGSQLLYTTGGGEIQSREVPSLTVRAHFAVPDGMSPVAVTPSGLILVSSTQGSAWLDPKTGAVVKSAAFEITHPSFSADGYLGATGSDSGALFRVWREDDATQLCAPPLPADPAIVAAAPSRDGRTLAVAHGDGSVELRPIAPDGSIGAATGSVATGLTLEALAVSDQGQRIGVMSPAGTNLQNVTVVDFATGSPVFNAVAASRTRRLALSPDGGWVAFRATANELRAVGLQTGATVSIASKGRPYDDVISFSNDGARLAVEASDGAEIWRLADGVKETTFAMPQASTDGIGLSPDWSVVAGVEYVEGTGIPRLQVWSPADGPSTARAFGFSGSLIGPPRFDAASAVLVGYSVDGHSVTTDGDLYAWHVWDVATGTPLRGSTVWSEPVLPIAGGARILTGTSSALIAWCR